MSLPARPRRLAPLLALGVAATLLPQLTPQQAAASPAPGTTAQQLAPYAQQRLAWGRCPVEAPATMQCATLKVPLDYRRPDGRHIDIAISRLRTSVPGKRRGILTFNPGGPGGPGLDFPVMAAGELPREVTEQYDLIGFDPRGIGESTPVTCGLRGSDLLFPRPTRTRAEFDANAAWARKVAERCRATAGAVLPHITTRNTARDMDVMRAALGERKLNYYGLSYGTALGAAYAQLFPHRADRFVMDSAIDPKRMWRGMYRVLAPTAEDAFWRWAGWTAERASEYRLGSTPEEVTRTFWRLVEGADREAVELDGATYDGTGVRNLLRAKFVRVRASAELVVRLREAAAGRPAAPPAASTSPGSTSPGPAVARTGVPDDNLAMSRWAVVCGDGSDWPRDPEAYWRDVTRDAVRYPLYGDFVSGISPCAFWPKAAEPAVAIDNRVPAVIVQNEWDPQTPLSGGQSMHRSLKGSRMVTVAGGEGHGVRFYTDTQNACADRQADAYLATGRLPATDVTCAREERAN
ncbi:alpha/beta hydrolase [Streptomyces sp. NPDC050504]|uniref:alpha/beta hydrolase n=1 Tax=Streptomyces sp. NPDC050504 TaxID=3365618 RepID=UPI0037AB7ABB